MQIYIRDNKNLSVKGYFYVYCHFKAHVIRQEYLDVHHNLEDRETHCKFLGSFNNNLFSNLADAKIQYVRNML